MVVGGAEAGTLGFGGASAVLPDRSKTKVGSAAVGGAVFSAGMVASPGVSDLATSFSSLTVDEALFVPFVAAGVSSCLLTSFSCLMIAAGGASMTLPPESLFSAADSDVVVSFSQSERFRILGDDPISVSSSSLRSRFKLVSVSLVVVALMVG